MTVDYAILYIPGRNPGFALDERRFNVATSRSRSTTLIITDIQLEYLHSLSPKVSTFIKKCDVVSLNESQTANAKSDTDGYEDDIKALYPGLEDIVDQLLQNNIPFSHDGDVDLIDSNNCVIASAGMILHQYHLAIDPIDDNSAKIFKDYGYNIVSAKDFEISMLNNSNN
jgi:hypothetical protein